MTVEGQLGAGNGGRVHLWRWTMAEDRIDSSEYAFGSKSSQESVKGADDDDDEESLECQEEDSEEEEDAIGIEEAYRDLSGTLRIIQGQKALLHERGGHMEMRLDAAEDRIKKVLGRLTNIESLVRVNAKELFGEQGSEKRRMSRSLRHFISSNFTDGQKHLDEVSSTMSPSQMSSVARGQASDGEEEVSEASDRLRVVPRLKTFDSEASLANSPEPSPARETFLAEVEELRNSGGNQSWVLDALSLHERTGRRALLALAEAVVVPKAAVLGTSDKTMRTFMTEVHRKYEGEFQNPFHNEAHATIVCHSTHWLAVRSKAWASMSEHLQVATDIAALAHDVGHFGRNNAFCTSAGHELALIYNDRSILENMHSATCFQLMKGIGCNILSSMSRENRRLFREHVVGLILATDMTTHFDFLGKLRVRVASEQFNVQDNAEDRRLVAHCYLKAADLGHAALPWEMHERWAFRLLTEFYEQGDEERSLGIPVSPMCERSGNVADFRESQKGFLQFVILPLFKELATVTFPEVSETCLTRIEINAEEWVKGDPNSELVKIIKAPAGPAKSTVSASPMSPKKKSKLKKAIFEARVDSTGSMTSVTSRS
eukprot:gb/GFBE01071996.1/.p1 GENE.gb/GFBE01071996.1/~~gb/GFBE01071996.1/.p1  ORF type:complete len:601 (+),score=111.00 gb/GFBE01071996.1/:1-1803(+)